MAFGSISKYTKIVQEKAIKRDIDRTLKTL